MANPTPHIRPHGNRIRGANLPRTSPLFEGPFGRIFRALPAADFGDNDQQSLAALNALATKMIAKRDPADPKDGPDPEESGIPAAYTYLGQFIDHDLTFDPASSLQRQNDPEALVDFRTPRFDLDNVYGRGPDDQPYMYADGRTFNLGDPLHGAAANPRARDLPRSELREGARKTKARAIIGDPRNDENTIVSQLQGLFHRFHNKVALDHPKWDFVQVQREVRFHYQWMLINDFLPKVISPKVLDHVLPHLKKKTNIVKDPPCLELYHPKEDLFMPLEFSAAAYRFGHSMVRPGYRLNENVGPLPIVDFNPKKPSLTGFRPIPNNHAIDWYLFADLEPRDPDNIRRTQLAYKIDTSLVDPLGSLPTSIAVNPKGLAQRNLERGWRMRLPSAQNVARAMGLKPLADKDILIGKFTGEPADTKSLIPITSISSAFADNCPLWTYVLAETIETAVALKTSQGVKKIKTRKLGPVGGRIVAETFVGILLGDSSSYLSQNPLWVPSTKRFGLRELISFALQDKGILAMAA